MNSYDDWITAKELVRRIHGEDTSENADRYFWFCLACLKRHDLNSFITSLS